MKQSKPGITRRSMAVMTVAAGPVMAQSPPPPDELAAARAQSKQNAVQLRKHPVPMLLEPSFLFRP